MTKLTPLLLGALLLPLVNLDGVAAPANGSSGAFGVGLLSKLITAGDDNVVISPLSLELALGMVYTGCSGTSAEELSRVIGFGPLSGSTQITDLLPAMSLVRHLPATVTLKIANSLWSDRSTILRQEFQTRVKNEFGAEIRSTDLATSTAMNAINEWVAKATEGKITGLLQQPPKPPLVLINAVYFKGPWRYQFSADQDSPGKFHRDDSSQCDVTMMKRGLKAPYLATDDFQAVELPYDASALAMVLILPQKETGVANLVRKLATGSWKETLKQFSDGRGTITLPRFKITYRNSLVPALTTLGLKTLFEPSRDFAGIFDDPRQFFVSDIIQQTFLRVDENGSEAAAATEVQIEASAMRPSAPKPFDLVFDRPFLFAIIDSVSSEIVFIGVLRDPERAKL